VSEPLVSCIVPVHNCERFLGAALESVLAQTQAATEPIVVDDGSTDGSADVARSFGEAVAYVYQANAGHAAARNRGLELARGDFVAFLDADDLWLPDKLERQLGRFAERPGLELCFSWLRNFVEGTSPESPEAEYEDFPGYSAVTLLARRAVFERIGGFDSGLRHGNDRDWLLRAAEERVTIEMLPEVLVYRRLHGANQSLRMAESSRAEYLRIVKASLERRRARSGQGRPRPYDLGAGDREQA
jgi:glycosyltransferase involved in cell wall biosynthesis